MHTLTIFSAFLISTILAFPHAQYGPGNNNLASPTSIVDILAASTSREDVSASETIFSTTTRPIRTTFATITSLSVDNSTLPANTAVPTATTTDSSSLVPSPTPSTSPLPQAGVYICNDVDWSGTCIHHFSNPTSAPGDCVQLDGTASSIGPDEGFTCWFFTNTYCRPLMSDGLDFIQLEYPGTGNMLQTFKGNLNDKIYSYFCLPEPEVGAD